MVIPSTLAKFGVPILAAVAGGAVTFEIGPNLGTVLTAIVNAVAAGLIGHALRKRASTALALNESRATRRKTRRGKAPHQNQP